MLDIKRQVITAGLFAGFDDDHDSGVRQTLFLQIRSGEITNNIIQNLKNLYREQKVDFDIVNINDLISETLKLLNSEIVIPKARLATFKAVFTLFLKIYYKGTRAV